MKQAIILMIFGLSPNLVFCQEWQILSSHKTNFQKNNFELITNQIFPDSITVEDTDTIFHLNRIVCENCFNMENGPLPCDTCYGRHNQPQSLGLRIRKFATGEIDLEFPDKTLHLNSTAPVGTIFTYEAISQVTAEVISIELMTFLGISDSVKTIQCSNGDFFKISKNYGLIEQQLSGDHYLLAGFDDTEIGDHLIRFSDIFDFQIGDSLEYHLNGGASEGGQYIKRRIILDSLTTIGDSLIYFYHGVDAIINYGWSGSYSYSEAISDSFIFEVSTYAFLNEYYPLEIKANSTLFFVNEQFNEFYGSCLGGNEIIRIGYDENGFRTLQYGQERDEDGYPIYDSPVMYFKEMEYPYLLYPVTDFDSFDDSTNCFGNYWPTQFSEEFKEGLGRTFSTFIYDELHDSMELKAFTKYGLRFGEFSGAFEVGQEEYQSPSFHIFPNPAKSLIQVNLSSTPPYHLELYDYTGKLIGNFDVYQKNYSIDISDLTNGFYTIRAFNHQLNMSSSFIKE